ncbi:hypothetical protein DFJ73DRAFT_543369 [Zopfochytrium polystomum]|nr:hypothetical protein DFJ73DRAFT_543369 [Zopfochytrium polystomum]
MLIPSSGGKFLWGIVRQGYHCRCGFNAHGKCVPLVATACPGPPRMKSPSSTDRSVPSIAGATEVLPPSSSSSTSSLAPQATESELSNQDPPLNLLTTTPRNFTRFVTRLGPVVHALEGTEDILMWRDPARTLVALLGFVFLCMTIVHLL